VEAALAGSEFLIVVCSPRSAQSQWVNHEVAWFKTHRDPTRILALIVDGEPGGGEEECFPKALTHRVEADLTITDRPEDAPLAADARDSGDGKRKARLKLAAALLGVGLDELVGRDDRRRALRQRWVTAASLLFGGSMAGLAWFAVQARDEAQVQRAESDSLVEFMLTDLREKLEPVGRLDALDVVGQRALKYYAGQKPGNLDADALGRRSRALHLVGEVRDLRGDSETALVAFRQAAATTGEQLARDPDNPQRIFDHAQSVFWVGAIAFQREELGPAESSFHDYERLASQLVALDAKKPEWLTELKYANSNLGTLLLEQGRYTDADRKFTQALEIIEDLSNRNSEDLSLQIELATSISWLVTTKEFLGERYISIKLLIREFDIYGKVLKTDPGNQRIKSQLVNALASLARVQLANGALHETTRSYRTALVLSDELLRTEPGNSEWLEVNVALRTYLAEALFLSQSYPQARTEIGTARRALDLLERRDPKNLEWGLLRRAMLDLNEATLDGIEGRDGRALALLASIRRRAPEAAKASQLYALDATRRRAALLMGDLSKRDGNSAAAIEAWKAALAPNRPSQRPRAELDQAVQFAVLRRLNRTDEARAIGTGLDRAGFRHPFYTREVAKAAQVLQQPLVR
jgi:tetratricopeptide (TPR) repeat protein